MKKFLNLKRLKIAEQILIVLLGAVIVPMAISGFIINNINQQSIRSQLRDSATLIAQMVSEEIDIFWVTSQNELKQINLALETIKGESAKQKYLQKVLAHSKEYEKIQLVKSQEEVDKIRESELKNKAASIWTKTNDGRFLIATFNTDRIKTTLFRSLMNEKRQIYAISQGGEILANHDYTNDTLNESIKHLPKKLKLDTPVVFGEIKNQPIVYLKKTNPDIIIVVDTTEKITKKVINENRFKIILAVLVASMAVIFVVGLYTYYLYINIRQLFKGIIAISKGNYQRRIRLLTNVFTPYEIIFLAFEFNRMANQIHKSYLQVQKKNTELKKLNEFRSNLIDTVSHEFRTPLTSIQGYTSRLLRQDIQIDEETKVKSLKIIKKQSERLKRMVEDLLVIPDIEGEKIRTNIEPVWLNKTTNSAITLVKSEKREIENLLREDFPLIMADKDRLEQVFVNLLENADKYADENSKITIEGQYDDNFARIYIKNDCPLIQKEKLNKLFEKFTRIDDKTTRTTRGTGLGLFIVKGLVEAMNGEIRLHSSEEKGFVVEIQMPVFKPAGDIQIDE